jgi:spore coat polysaccharide biosynthesis protein SpsF (cytidylyltransferase family)
MISCIVKARMESTRLHEKEIVCIPIHLNYLDDGIFEND